MDNTILLEKLGKHTIKNAVYLKEYLNEEVVGEYSLYGGPAKFIKDSIKYLVKIKGLKDGDEIIIDTIEPVGFLTIYKDGDEYEMSLALQDHKTKTFKSKNAGQIIGKVISLFKDQLLIGRKNNSIKHGK